MSNSNMVNALKPAVFLDRDGTINIEKNYLYQPEEFEFISGAVEAISLLGQSGYQVVVVTNQSGVARGYYTEADVQALHQHIDALLAAAGTRVDAWYYCPHHPDGNAPYNEECRCRKPLPGMLQQAAKEHGLDLSRSWMVGDKMADLEAGQAVGCQSVLVLTGYGVETAETTPASVPVCPDLLAAARLITAV